MKRVISCLIATGMEQLFKRASDVSDNPSFRWKFCSTEDLFETTNTYTLYFIFFLKYVRFSSPHSGQK